VSSAVIGGVEDTAEVGLEEILEALIELAVQAQPHVRQPQPVFPRERPLSLEVRDQLKHGAQTQSRRLEPLTQVFEEGLGFLLRQSLGGWTKEQYRKDDDS
jgi:hypothetical protein